MITNLEITRFRGIQKLTLEDISRLTLIGGKNNSSKTSILEAIFMLHDQKDPTVFNRLAGWRGIVASPMESEFIFAPFFYDFNMSSDIKICSNKSSKDNLELIISLDEKYTRQFKVSNNHINNQFSNMQNSVISEAIKFVFQSSRSILVESYLSIIDQGFNFEVKKDVQKKVKNVVFMASRQASYFEEDLQRLSRLEIKNNVSDVVEVLQLIEPSIVNISGVKIGNSSMIYVDIGKGRKIPIASMGDGITRLLSMVLAIASTPNGIVLIDEIENGLHYSVLEKVWSGLSSASLKFNCQILATTHSHEFLSYVNKSNQDNDIKDFSYFRLENTNAKIEGKRFNSELLNVAMKNEMEVR